jgi:cytochrome c
MLILKTILMGLVVCVLAGCTGVASWAGILRADAAAPTLVGDPARGELIFRTGVSESPPCSTCHQVTAGSYGFNLGPNLEKIAERAATRIAGQDARRYIEDSILHPHDFIVPGFRDIMYDQFDSHLSAQDLADLVAYLMTL